MFELGCGILEDLLKLIVETLGHRKKLHSRELGKYKSIG